MKSLIPKPFARSRVPTGRWRIALGFVIVAALIGAGVLPARKGFTVRLVDAPPRRPALDRRRRRGRARRTLGLQALARALARHRRRTRSRRRSRG